MKKRSLFAVFILPFVTFGIYGIVWAVKTKDEMNRLGAKIPTAWLLIVPFANFYWYYKYSEGVEQITNHKMSTVLVFLLELFLGVIGNTILQSEFNKLADIAQPMVANPTMPVAASINGVVNDASVDVVPGRSNTASVAPVATTTAAAPFTSSAPTEPADQYQTNMPTPEATVNPQSTSPTPPEDNHQTPLTPGQF